MSTCYSHAKKQNKTEQKIWPYVIGMEYEDANMISIADFFETRSDWNLFVQRIQKETNKKDKSSDNINDGIESSAK